MTKTQALKQLQDYIRRKHLAISTEKSYLNWASRYMDWLATRKASPGTSSEAKVEAFLTHLAKTGVAASTQNQAFNALNCLYRHGLGTPLVGVDSLRAKQGQRVRTAPSRQEVAELFAQLQDHGGYPTNLLARLLYGCGLRVGEGLALRLRDLDFSRCRVTVRGGKGNKDRVVALPKSLLPALQRQAKLAKALAAEDVAKGLPVQLPHRMAAKYPRSAFAPAWAFLFPGKSPCEHPRTGRLVRYHFHPANIQRALTQASQRADLAEPIRPHTLRHGYATHLLESGANPKAIQEALGHTHLDTTMGYLHAHARDLASPLDSLAA
ncbi:integron integrase [Roseibacillus persicicus]|uniref:integron integrase n=1 Tax=Roseibacillus persicicus TaxID=454148 RepID=UPI00398AEE56